MTRPQQDPVAHRRAELIAAIARLLPDLQRRRDALAEDERALARMVGELVVIEREGIRAVTALAAPRPLFLTMKEACSLAGCTRATMVKPAKRHNFGWLTDGRWRIGEVDLRAYLENEARDQN